MNRIYSIKAVSASDGVALDPIWTQGASDGLSAGYTGIVPVQIGEGLVLFAYDKTTQKTDVYLLSDSAPWVQLSGSHVDLSGGPWDIINAFVLGNEPYLMTYRRETGTFGFYHVANDLSVSKPYIFSLIRNTPTKNFTTVVPFTSLGQQYFLGYDFDTGIVANFNLVMTSSSAGGTPPLLASNVWYHQWARGWMHFAFFQLGGSNFFFKINKDKLNVNIDHINDNPSMGTVEVGSYLQSLLPDALSIDITAHVPWINDEPHLLTYIASSGATSVYGIHADCLGWTNLNTSVTVEGVSLVIPYRIKDTTFALFYKG